MKEIINIASKYSEKSNQRTRNEHCWKITLVQLCWWDYQSLNFAVCEEFFLKKSKLAKLCLLGNNNLINNRLLLSRKKLWFSSSVKYMRC